jgi:hypothetical protein
VKLQPGKFRAWEWLDLVLGFSVSPWTENVERSQGTQASSAESLHRPTAYFPQKVFSLFPSYFPLTLASSSLPEFERRSQGSIRGDAKKFALERAQDFIVRFGLSDEFHGVEEPESRFKEVRSFACMVIRLFNRCLSYSKFTTGSRIPLDGPVENSKVALDLQKKQQRKVCLVELWVHIPRGFFSLTFQ